MNKQLSLLMGVGFIVLNGAITNALASDCLPAKGKITNNIQPGQDTLGVVAFTLGNQKLKCALAGEFQSEVPGQVNYRHTIVCDDKASPDEAQAQLTFNTYFVNKTETGACEFPIFGENSFSFEEISFPDPITARGAFAGVDGGTLNIWGDYNCSGGIVMKFEGEICSIDF